MFGALGNVQAKLVKMRVESTSGLCSSQVGRSTIWPLHAAPHVKHAPNYDAALAQRPAAKLTPSWSSPESQVTSVTEHLDLASLAPDDDVVCIGAQVLPIPSGCAIQTMPLQLQTSGGDRGLLLFWILGSDPADKNECSNPLLNRVTCALITSNAVQTLPLQKKSPDQQSNGVLDPGHFASRILRYN